MTSSHIIFTCRSFYWSAYISFFLFFFFFSSRRRHTRSLCDWSSDVCSSDLPVSADQLAAKTACHPRLVREWLDGQTAAGLVEFDASGDHYRLACAASSDRKSVV